MYFWRIEALKTRLIEAPLSDREVLPYQVICSALIAAILGVSDLFPVDAMNAWDIVGRTWTVLLAVLGTIYFYRQNGGSTGAHLLQRYLVIGWVVGIRWTVALLLVFGALTVAVTVFEDFHLPEVTTWQETLLFGAAEALYYWRMGHHVFQVAHVAPPRS